MRETINQFIMLYTGDILKKHKRNLALAAQLDKMGTLESGFGEQDPIIGDDTNGMSMNMRESFISNQ